MKVYKNLDGNAGVVLYEIGNEDITVRFAGSRKLYKYSYAKAGKEHVENMKILAEKGKGLTTYISRFVHDLYD